MINYLNAQKSKIKSKIKILGSCIYLVFDFLIKSQLESKNLGDIPSHNNEFLANDFDFIADMEIIEKHSSRKLSQSYNEMIIGGCDKITLKEFVSSQNFESLTKQMETLLDLIKSSLDQFKGMLWNLEKFQKAKIKRTELSVLKNKFGSNVISNTKYEELLRKYKIYESIDSRITSQNILTN